MSLTDVMLLCGACMDGSKASYNYGLTLLNQRRRWEREEGDLQHLDVIQCVTGSRVLCPFQEQRSLAPVAGQPGRALEFGTRFVQAAKAGQ